MNDTNKARDLTQLSKFYLHYNVYSDIYNISLTTRYTSSQLMELARSNRFGDIFYIDSTLTNLRIIQKLTNE